MSEQLIANVSCVAVGGRGILIEGAPGSGKSTLALALIDRGAILIGDDGIVLEQRGARAWALPPPNITGRLEVRGVGIVAVPTTSAPLALAMSLGGRGDRLPEPILREFGGALVPYLRFDSADSALALRAEWALRVHGLQAG